MNSPIAVPAIIVQETLAELQTWGRRRSERIVLWLGSRTRSGIRVKMVWIPDQITGRDFFEIPRKGMQALFAALREHRLMVAAQVHTHPGRAFHSSADNEWAIVRHAGALSLVLPYFSMRTDHNAFARDAAVFVLSATNEWVQAHPINVHRFYEILP